MDSSIPLGVRANLNQKVEASFDCTGRCSFRVLAARRIESATSAPSPSENWNIRLPKSCNLNQLDETPFLTSDDDKETGSRR